MERLLVITNSGAGTADEENLGAALRVLREAYEVEVVATSSLEELDAALGKADERTVVVAGGDGSLHAVVQTLHDRGELAGTTLGLLPLGTGNDFARSVELPLEADAAARALVAATIRPVDLVVADDGTVVVNNVHLGAGAQAARYGADLKEKLGQAGVGKLNLGKLGYPLGAVKAAATEPVRVRIEVDGQEVSDEEVLMVALGNGASVGGGAELTPDADVSDGRIDVMVSTATGPLARVAYVAALARGAHPERDDVSYLHGQSVRITGEKFWTSADGELSGPHTEQSWRLERAAFRMLLPSPALPPE